MHSDDDDDDLSEFRQPVPADDRLWRHPSEVGSGASMPLAAMRGRLPEPPPRTRRRRTLAGVAAIAGLIGATTAIGAVVLAGGLRPRIIERTLGRTPASASTSTVSTRSVAVIVGDLQRSVVRVEATAGGVTRQGAAVVVSQDLLVTSARLVQGNPIVTIRSTDAMVHEATVLGIDQTSGIAALKVTGADLVPAPAAPLRPEAGDTAIMMSVTTGGDGEVSMGIVSSVDDAADGPGGTLRDLITIDRPVPATSDGGALVDDTGKVLGICLVPDDALHTEGHAVPIDVARDVATDLHDHGSVHHAWLGVQGVDLPDKSALDLDVPGGGLLTEVTPDGPGERSGLRAGDVIIRMGGREVTRIKDVAVAIRNAEPGEETDIVFLRGRERHTITVQFGEPPPPT